MQGKTITDVDFDAALQKVTAGWAEDDPRWNAVITVADYFVQQGWSLGHQTALETLKGELPALVKAAVRLP